MVSPNKPQNTDPPQNQTETQFERVEPLKLQAVNGFRARFKALLKKWGLILGLSAAAGGYTGYKAQESYREMTGYNPDKAAVTDTIKKTGEASEPKEQSKEVSDEDKKAKGWLTKAKDALKKAKEWSGRKMEGINDKSKLIQQYREAKQGLKNTYEGILKFGDNAVYWSAFALFFLATSMLASKISDIKKSFTQGVDPAVEKNMKAITDKINEIGQKVNQLGERIDRGDKVMVVEAKELMDKFVSATAGLEDNIDKK